MTTNYEPNQTYAVNAAPKEAHTSSLFGGQHYSPANSAMVTPPNISPTSPRDPAIFPHHLPLATRQLRPPKSPMYTPAVLRPTERPPRPSPLTPPRSIEGSTDSLTNIDSRGNRPSSRSSTSDSKSLNNNSNCKHASVPIAPGRKPRSLHSLREDIVDSLSPKSPSIASRFSSSDVKSGLLPPTRDHWKPDANATICDAAICQKSFSLFERRHHCRHCGHVFCNTHSYHTVPLDQYAEFDEDGMECRACKHCWDRYREWLMARIESKENDDAETPMTPSIGVAGKGKGGDGGDIAKQPGTVAASVPRDWNWSTF
ncbi:hypothetical protein MMC09_000989 [Bachmanniomyces sp. S44760]|nr:hypothetical protein [Bachmanniomyces sp. S44760]